MRILLTGYTLPDSGVKAIPSIAAFLGNLAGTLQKRHEVDVYIRKDKPFGQPWIHEVWAPRASWMLYPYFLKGALKRASADVFHADYVVSGAALGWAQKRPRIVSFHDAIPFQEDPKTMSRANQLKRKFYFKCFDACRSADALIALSQDAKQDAIELAHIPEDHVHVVSNGVDTKKFRPLPKTKHQKLRIGYLGGLDGRKNVGLLLDAYEILARERDDVELHIAGSGSNLEKFKSRNLPRATFYGFLPDSEVVSFYNSLDVFVFPTLKEGFGNMAAEAMACGVPVVALNRSSMPEVVGDAGILTQTSPEALAKGIERLLDNAALRKRFSVKGRKRAETFTWDACAKNMEKVYETVLGNR